MIDLAVVDLSRLQFALTALYHFLFVPLTLGLSFMLVIMESIYVMTRRPIWRTITRFWGVLFGINFVLGVATGLTMEFQFGMNWSYFSHYVGDIFGAPLAIEGLMAFFLEATFVGLMFFGWDKLSRHVHLFVTFMVALGTNLSALWILIANGWMQNPVGSTFNPETMRMEVVDFMAVLFNPVAQAKFVHTVSAGYVIASVFVLGISAFYLLKGRHKGFAKRSMTVAAAFGLMSSLSVVVLGDESGYALTDNQKMKLAAIEAAGDWQWQGRILTRDGRVRWADIKASARQLSAEHVVWDGVVWDISDNKAIELELAESRAQLRELSAHLESVREEEKAHIAREVHDELGQVLTVLKLETSMCELGFAELDPALAQRLDSMKRLIAQLFQRVRDVATALRPPILDAGIASAIEWQVRRFEERTQIPCLVEVPEHLPRLPDAQAIGLFRILQESLTNVMRHARAQTVSVQLQLEGEMLCLRVSDDGCGFADAARSAGSS